MEELQLNENGYTQSYCSSETIKQNFQMVPYDNDIFRFYL